MKLMVSHVLHRRKYLLLLILILILAAGSSIAVYASKADSAPTKITNKYFTYKTTYTDDESIQLHVIRTLPSNIHLQTINENVTAYGLNGINGGFFWQSDLLSIAAEDDFPVNGKARSYGSGWYNAKYPRGTLVYEENSEKLSVQIASSVNDLEIVDRSGYWAQGGISMSLQDDAAWQTISEQEGIPFPDEDRLRSAIVYDREGYIYLIVSSTPSTTELFRQAIKEQVAEDSLVDGIFLDGDGSSQMLADKVRLPGDGRKVVQMIRIEFNT